MIADKVNEAIKQLGVLRNSEVIVYCARDGYRKPIDSKDGPAFYEMLRRGGKRKCISLLLHTEGGELNEAYRITELLREYSVRLEVMVPYKAHSAGTILCLGADSLILGPLAELTPLRPTIKADRPMPLGVPNVLGAEEVEAIANMGRIWFGLSSSEEKMELMTLLFKRIYPSVCGAAYLADRYICKLADNLIRKRRPRWSTKERSRAVGGLRGAGMIHSHKFSRRDIERLGLNVVVPDPAEEDKMWEILTGVQDRLAAAQGNENEVERAVFTCALLAQNYYARYRQILGTLSKGPVTGTSNELAVRNSLNREGWERFDSNEIRDA